MKTNQKSQKITPSTHGSAVDLRDMGNVFGRPSPNRRFGPASSGSDPAPCSDLTDLIAWHREKGHTQSRPKYYSFHPFELEVSQGFNFIFEEIDPALFCNI